MKILTCGWAFKNRCIAFQAASQQSVEIELYYETLCPQSQRFITDQLWPAYQKLSKYIDLIYFNPYGKAETLNEDPYNLKFRCEHGPDECRGGKYTFCFYNLLLGSAPPLTLLTSQAITQVHCIESSQDPTGPSTFEKVSLCKDCEKNTPRGLLKSPHLSPVYVTFAKL